MSRNEAFQFLCEWASKTHPGNDEFNPESIVDGKLVAELLYSLCEKVFTMSFVEEVHDCEIDEFGSTAGRLHLIQKQVSYYFTAIYKKDPTQKITLFPRVSDLCNKDESALLNLMFIISFISVSQEDLTSKNFVDLLESKGRTLRRRIRRMEANLDEFLTGETEPEEDVCALKDRNNDLNNQLNVVMNELTKLRNNEILLADDLKRSQNQLNNLIEEKEKSLERRSLDEKFMSDCVHAKEDMIRSLEEKIQELEQLLDERDVQLTDLEAELSSLRDSYERDTKSYEEIREQTERELAKLKNDQEKARTGSPDQAIMTDLRTRNDNLTERNAILEMKVKLLEDQREEIEGIQRLLAQKTKENEQLQERFEQIREQNDTLKEENERLREKTEELERSEVVLTNDLNNTKEKMEKEIQEMRESTERSRLQSQLVETMGSEEDIVVQRTSGPARPSATSPRPTSDPKILQRISNFISSLFVWLFSFLFLISIFAIVRYGWCSYNNEPFTLFGEVRLNGRICRLYPDVCLFTQLMKRPIEEF
ncbi:unnamed protein product [Bursaphelenchus xylophilus]|uniref:(pine wood nematode) hypothetical protein n=1 Tax=Bursaphelenchus xylophilus TaxID=6326 RepID=A0A1I7RZC9_BURXY|nr:unnamed protein product [Bursaphelenchus xylophilus]CAG9106592.1 unnamed protein product [Bursaphelenchus xylophilus]